MNIADIFRTEGRPGLRRLAEAAGTDHEYLWQLAVRFQNRKPSIDMALRLIAADPRLTLDDLYLDTSADAA